MRTFTTEFGHVIPLIENYRNLHRLQTSGDVLYEKPAPPQLDLYGFLKDLFEYFMMLDFFEGYRLKGPWKRALDIGGEEGAISYMLRADGKSFYTANIEMRDLRHTLNPALFAGYLGHFRSRLSGFSRDKVPSDPSASEVTKIFYELSEEFNYDPFQGVSLWKSRFEHAPLLDEFICGDIYEHQGSYDLITAFLCLDWFDLDRLFHKVYTLLNNQGVFYFIANYWWWPVNSTAIVGDFPYACQRLTANDLLRYFQENYPEEAPDIIKRYNYFNVGKYRPTLNDYISMAYSAGLSLLGERRIMPVATKHPRTPFMPRILDAFPDTRLSAVLEDIHRFRPDVELIDLQTAFIEAAFIKMPRSDRPLADVLKAPT